MTATGSPQQATETGAAQAGRLIVLDRILDVVPGERGVAVRNVPHTLDILDSHFPRFPVLPGVLILGSMGQLAALVLEAGSGRAWRLVGARRVRYRHFVQPGDQMQLTIEVKEAGGQEATCKATATVDGRPVTTAAALQLVPAEDGGAP